MFICEDYYIIFWDDKPMGIDKNSGGHPFKTEHPSEIKYWRFKEEAKRYTNMFPDCYMNIRKVSFIVVEESTNG